MSAPTSATETGRERLLICDVGPRDGLQNERVRVDTETKIAFARGLLDAGLPALELGSFVSPRAVPQMADSDDVFRALTDPEAARGPESAPMLTGLVLNERGYDRALAAFRVPAAAE